MNQKSIVETENICNMPELFTMELHQSEQTGKFYLNFLSRIGLTEVGEWIDIEITSKDVENLFEIVKKGKIVPEEE